MLTQKLEGAAKSTVPAYIEDVFSTWLYTGNGSTQTITNGIDLAGEGGMVWLKARSVGISNNLYDTVRGATNLLRSDTTGAQATNAEYLQSFTSTGFSVGRNANVNGNTYTYASWTFRKQPKFFDVVTYTGNGANTTIPHNLGSVPGCIITKCISAAGDDWATYHRSIGASEYINLNTTGASQSTSTGWNDTAPTSTVFSLGPSSLANGSGKTYVAYLFAHNAGGFGLTGTDNVISCGSYTSNGSTISVNLGWEPQWILIKRASNTGNWNVTDNMRGMTAATANASAPLFPNLSDAELDASSTNGPAINATGFTVPYSSSAFNYPSGETYIYIAIRRGPMRVPTDGTKVFLPVSQNAGGTVTTNFPVDLTINRGQSSAFDTLAYDRLRGNKYFFTNLTDAEGTASLFNLANNTGYTDGNYSPPRTIIYWNFRRAPGFFDEVCYTGNGSTQTITHNLGVAPELIILKTRNASGFWPVYAAPLGNTQGFYLDDTGGTGTRNWWNNTSPTASVFTINGTTVNQTFNYVAYLFASCPGVSKVGSYTGTGTTLQINCGFTGGARFVMIKRTDASGDWYVWDSARGIVAGNDPYLLLNSTAAEVTSTDYVDTYSAGFEISSTAPAAINASGGTFIFLAIA